MRKRIIKFFISIFSNPGPHHADVISSINHCSCFTFCRILCVKWNTENKLINLWTQEDWSASLPKLHKLLGSAFNDICWCSWCDLAHIGWFLEYPWPDNFLKKPGVSFHLIQFFVCLDTLSASLFIDPGRYWEVIVVCFNRFCYIPLLTETNVWFLVPSVFQGIRKLCCPLEYGPRHHYSSLT